MLLDNSGETTSKHHSIRRQRQMGIKDRFLPKRLAIWRFTSKAFLFKLICSPNNSNPLPETWISINSIGFSTNIKFLLKLVYAMGMERVVVYCFDKEERNQKNVASTKQKNKIEARSLSLLFPLFESKIQFLILFFTFI